MTVSLVSLLGANVDEASVDLATHLTASGVDSSFASFPHGRRRQLVERGEAGIVWMCGWLALETRTTDYEVVAAPTFSGEPTASYRSVIVARRRSGGLAALSGDRAVWAMNEPESWSGHRAVLAECDLRGLPEPSHVVWSGSHVESIRMVAAGEVDVASIDSTVWRSADPDDLNVVDVTRAWPSPPILARRDLLDRLGELPTLIADAQGIRGLDSLDLADWGHLDPLSGRRSR